MVKKLSLLKPSCFSKQRVAADASPQASSNVGSRSSTARQANADQPTGMARTANLADVRRSASPNRAAASALPRPGFLSFSSELSHASDASHRASTPSSLSGRSGAPSAPTVPVAPPATLFDVRAQIKGTDFFDDFTSTMSKIGALAPKDQAVALNEALERGLTEKNFPMGFDRLAMVKQLDAAIKALPAEIQTAAKPMSNPAIPVRSLAEGLALIHVHAQLQTMRSPQDFASMLSDLKQLQPSARALALIEALDTPGDDIRFTASHSRHDEIELLKAAVRELPEENQRDRMGSIDASKPERSPLEAWAQATLCSQFGNVASHEQFAAMLSKLKQLEPSHHAAALIDAAEIAGDAMRFFDGGSRLEELKQIKAEVQTLPTDLQHAAIHSNNMAKPLRSPHDAVARAMLKEIKSQLQMMSSPDQFAAALSEINRLEPETRAAALVDALTIPGRDRFGPGHDRIDEIKLLKDAVLALPEDVQHTSIKPEEGFFKPARTPMEVLEAKVTSMITNQSAWKDNEAFAATRKLDESLRAAQTTSTNTERIKSLEHYLRPNSLNNLHELLGMANSMPEKDSQTTILMQLPKVALAIPDEGASATAFKDLIHHFNSLDESNDDSRHVKNGFLSRASLSLHSACLKARTQEALAKFGDAIDQLPTPELQATARQGFEQRARQLQASTSSAT